jgi:hypothetical protein
MADQRKALRKNLMAFTSVYNIHSKALIGYIDDLTMLGVKVIGEKPVEVNQNFVLGIEFPQDAHETTTPRIATSARVAWCRSGKKPHQYNIGFEFTELKPENEKIIEAILRRYEFRRSASTTDID